MQITHSHPYAVTLVPIVTQVTPIFTKYGLPCFGYQITADCANIINIYYSISVNHISHLISAADSDTSGELPGIGLQR